MISWQLLYIVENSCLVGKCMLQIVLRVMKYLRVVSTTINKVGPMLHFVNA